MNKIYADADVGRKNIAFGIGLFLLLGVVAGIPLTVDFLGGSMMTADQYQAWKVIHGYSVFLAFVNFFFGYCVDRMNLTNQQKEISSWLFLIAGVIGGIGRSALMLLSLQGGIGSYAISLIETLCFVLGTLIVVRGLVSRRPAQRIVQP